MGGEGEKNDYKEKWNINHLIIVHDAFFTIRTFVIMLFARKLRISRYSSQLYSSLKIQVTLSYVTLSHVILSRVESEEQTHTSRGIIELAYM